MMKVLFLGDVKDILAVISGNFLKFVFIAKQKLI